MHRSTYSRKIRASSLMISMDRTFSAISPADNVAETNSTGSLLLVEGETLMASP